MFWALFQPSAMQCRQVLESFGPGSQSITSSRVQLLLLGPGFMELMEA